MPEPEIDPSPPEGSSSAMDGLLTVMASIGVFALAAKGQGIVLRSLPPHRLEAAKAALSKNAIAGLDKLVKHPTFKTLQKAFIAQPSAGPGPLEQMFREVDPSSMGLLQDLWTVSQLSNPGADFLSAIRSKVLTDYEVKIPQLAAGRHRRVTLDDLATITKGSKWREPIEKIIGPDGNKLDDLSFKLGIGRKQLGELRVDPWFFVDPKNKQDHFNLRSLNPLKMFDRMEQITVGGIPLFRVRSDHRGNKMGTAHFGANFDDVGETTNPVLKLLSGGKKDKGELVVTGGVAWSRRSAKDPFELLDGPFTKAGSHALELTSDPRMGQHFYIHHADINTVNQELYGIQGKPTTDLQKLSQVFGIDVGARGGFSRGKHGTVIDDILREPYLDESGAPRSGEGLRKWFIDKDPSGLLGSVGSEDLLDNRILNIGAESPLMKAIGAGQLYVQSTDPIQRSMTWLNQMTSRPYYLMSKFGVNVRPGKNFISTLGKASVLGVGAYMGAEAVRYADYALFDLPSETLRHTVGAGEYARQTVAQGTGLASQIEGMEEELPGAVTSPLAKALRIAGFGVAGAMLGKKFGGPKWATGMAEGLMDPNAKGVKGTLHNLAGRYVKTFAEREVLPSKLVGGAILGTGAGGLLGLGTALGDVTATREDVAARFRGDEKVPYRASAGWMLGRDPFSGGNIRFHKESSYSTFGSGYRDVAIYGSQGDKWKYGSWLPTVQNWGGARRLLNPYYVEDRHQHTRPYPVTAGHFGEVPIFGTMLEPTIGRLLKPGRFRDPYGMDPVSGASAGYVGGGAGGGGSHIAGTGGGQDALHSMNVMHGSTAHASLAASYTGVPGFRMPSKRDMDWMGFEYGNVIPKHAARHTDLTQTLAVQARNVEEFFGLRGFQMQMLRENIFGSAYPLLDRPVLSQSGTITSTARAYYDVEPGGLLGMCFHGDTLIDTEDGWKPIKSVEVGEAVMSNGVYRKVVNKFTRKPSHLLRMTVANISTDIVATPEHVFPVYKFYPCHERNSTACVPGSRQMCFAPGKLQKPKNKPEYRSVCGKECKSIQVSDIPLSEISKNDYLIVPGPKPSSNRLVLDLATFTDRTCSDKWVYNRASEAYAEIYEILDKAPATTRADLRTLGYKDCDAKEALYIYRHGKIPRFPRHITIDEDLAWVLGWWVAEGTSETSGRLQFSLHENETHFAERIGQIITERFGNSYSITQGDGKGIYLRVQCIPLQIILESLFGYGAHNKRIHPDVKTMPTKEVTAFFRGIVEGDGWYHESKGGYGSVSASLCRDVFQIGIALGLKGSLVLNYLEKPNGFYPQGTPRKDTLRSYVQWGGESANRLWNIMTGENRLYEGRYDSRSFLHNGDLYVRVVSIAKETVDTDLVFDLEIEDVHYYTANMISCHNSEYPRRLLLRPRKQPEVNFIPNVAPRWLPGTLSEFERDRGHHVDFHRGDPYAKIAQGEARLPGPGYEVLHQLHGGKSYDVLDNFLILADVAPHSQAYQIMKQEVDRMITRGDVTPEWLDKYQRAINRAQERSDFRVFHSKRYRGTHDFTIKEALSPTEFTTYEQPDRVMRLRGAPVSSRDDMELMVELQRQGLGPREAKSRASSIREHMFSHLKSMEGKKLEASIIGHQGGYLELEASSFLEEAKSLGVNVSTSDIRDQGILGSAYSLAGKSLGEAGYIAGGVLGFMKGSKSPFEMATKGSLASKLGWAAIGSAGAGLFGGWMENKFTADFSAIEHYKRFNLYGTSYADWDKPIDSFLKVWGHSVASTVTGAAGVDYTPGFRKQQRDIETYFDNLKHAKNMFLVSKGATFEDLEPTMAGLNYETLSMSTPGITRAIPASERQYFRKFAKESDPTVRKEILNNVPDYMKSIYLAIWKTEEGVESFEDPQLNHAFSEYVQPLIDTPVRERVSDYFSRHAVPDLDSGVWHPAVAVDAVKYKAIEAIGGNPHYHGLYSTQGARVAAFNPDVINIADEVARAYRSTSGRENFNNYQKLVRGHGQGSDLYNAPSFMFHASRGRVNMYEDERERVLNSIDNYRGKGIW